MHRILLLTQYKSSAILKRLLKVQHPTLQLYILKIIKSQVPFCGRKWRQSNMKVITGIYLNCRPDLRDEWLSSDVEGIVMESLPQEQALRALVKYYVASRFDDGTGAGEEGGEQRQVQDGSNSGGGRVGRPTGHGQAKSFGGSAAEMGEIDFNDANSGAPGNEGEGQHHDGSGSGPSASSYDFFESEFLLPPLRSRSTSSTHSGPGAAAYIPDDVVEGYLGEYEEILGEVFGTSMVTHHGAADVPAGVVPSSAVGSTIPLPASSPRQSPTMAAQRSVGFVDPTANPAGDATAAEEAQSLVDGRPGWSSGKWGLTQTGAQTAWNALGEILGQGGEGEGRGEGSSATSDSDTESIASIGELDFSRPNNERGAAEGTTQGEGAGGEGVRLGASEETSNEGKSDWEHLSPKEMRFLATQPRPPTPGSPTTSGPGSSKRTRRRSSAAAAERERQLAMDRERELAKVMPGMPRRTSGEVLRPVLTGLEDEDYDEGGEIEEEEDEEEQQPLPAPKAGGIDEVEHVFGQ